MNNLLVILNTGDSFLKNPFYSSTTFHDVFQQSTEILYVAFVVFIVCMIIFSGLKFTLFVTPEKKSAARNQLLVFMLIAAIIVISAVSEQIIARHVESWIAQIVGGVIMLIGAAGVYLLLFIKKVQTTSPFKLRE